MFPEDQSWFAFTPAADTAAAITLNNPRSGNGSLELTKTSNQGAAYLHEPTVLSFGAVSELTSLSIDWFIDPASEVQLPPELALRVYDFGDPRSFFLYWDTCSALTLQWNEAIAAAVQAHDALLVDLFARWPVAQHPDYIGPDGLHPTVAGYRTLAETFLTVLREQRIV